jgi:hypothetical protein
MTVTTAAGAPSVPDTPQTLVDRHESSGSAEHIILISALAMMSLIVAGVGAVADVEALRLIGGFGAVFFGIGAAPFQLFPRLNIWARLSAATLGGFIVLLGVAALMADIRPLWQPVPAAILFGAAALILHVIGLSRALPRRRRNLPSALALGVQTVRRANGQARLSLLLTIAGTILWLVPALTTRDPNPGPGGLLVVISPAWFAGLAALILALALGRRTAWAAALAALSFAVANSLTGALVYGMPRQVAGPKHVLITQYVLAHHHIRVTTGIYPAFSDFFSGMAWLCRIVGVRHPLGLATYWPVLLAFIRIAELRFLAGRIIRTTGRQWLVVGLVLLLDTFGMDYFSPQSVGYVMAIAVVGFVVRGETSRPMPTRALIPLLTLSGMVLAGTHELSPYELGGMLVVLAVLGQAPWWSVIAILAPAAAWAGVVHKAVSGYLSFSQLFQLGNFAPPKTVSTPGLERLSIVALQSHTVLLAMLVLMALAALGFLFNIRRRWSWAYGLCPGVGLAFIAINPYGNEGIFRAALFAVPWLVILAMTMPHSRPRLTRRGRARRTVRETHRWLDLSVSAGLIGLLATFVVAEYTMDATNIAFRSDWNGSTALAKQLSSSSYVLSVGGVDNPLQYPGFLRSWGTLAWDQVLTQKLSSMRHPGPSALVALQHRYESAVEARVGLRPETLYIWWSRSMLTYSRVYGLEAPEQMRAWLSLVQHSPAWKQIYHGAGGVWIFEYRPLSVF